MYLFPQPPPPHSILVEVLKYFCDAAVKSVTSKMIWGSHRGDIEDSNSLACDGESLESCHPRGIPEKPGSSKPGVLSEVLPTNLLKHSANCMYHLL